MHDGNYGKIKTSNGRASDRVNGRARKEGHIVEAARARHTACRLPCLGKWGGEERERGGLSSYELGFHISGMAHYIIATVYGLGLHAI